MWWRARSPHARAERGERARDTKESVSARLASPGRSQAARSRALRSGTPAPSRYAPQSERCEPAFLRLVPRHLCSAVGLGEREPDGTNRRLGVEQLHIASWRDFGEPPRQLLRQPGHDLEGAAGEMERGGGAAA